MFSPFFLVSFTKLGKFGNRNFKNKHFFACLCLRRCLLSFFSFIGVAQKWLHKNTRDRVFQIFLYFTLFVIFFPSRLFPSTVCCRNIYFSSSKFLLCGIFPFDHLKSRSLAVFSYREPRIATSRNILPIERNFSFLKVETDRREKITHDG